MPDTLKFEKRFTDSSSFVCPHCMRDVPLPSEEPHVVHAEGEFRPKLVAFTCPLCSETIRLDN